MSAWERARHIPWDRIPQDGSNLEMQKEQIFRQLHRETVEDELRSQERDQVSAQATNTTTTNTTTTTTESSAIVADDDQQINKRNNKHHWYQLQSSQIPYSNMELLRQAAFGGTIGSITGAVFGFMDSMRVAGSDKILVKASNSAKAKYIFQGTSRSAMLFGSFFGGFHVVKYGIRVIGDPGEVPEILMAGAISMSAMAYKPTTRSSMPYAAMLILMDSINMIMRQYRE